eukprot:gene2133-2421_t
MLIQNKTNTTTDRVPANWSALKKLEYMQEISKALLGKDCIAGNIVLQWQAKIKSINYVEGIEVVKDVVEPSTHEFEQDKDCLLKMKKDFFGINVDETDQTLQVLRVHPQNDSLFQKMMPLCPKSIAELLRKQKKYKGSLHWKVNWACKAKKDVTRNCQERSRKESEKGEKRQKKIGKHLKTILLSDISKEFPESTWRQVEDLELLLEGKAVGKDAYHVC